jgi:hypothetical protein
MKRKRFNVDEFF